LLVCEWWHETNWHDQSVIAIKELGPFDSQFFASGVVVKPNPVARAVTFRALRGCSLN
jgi:hypothetical protein